MLHPELAKLAQGGNPPHPDVLTHAQTVMSKVGGGTARTLPDGSIRIESPRGIYDVGALYVVGHGKKPPC